MPIPTHKVSFKLVLADAIKRQFPNQSIVDLSLSDLTNVPDLAGNGGKYLRVNLLASSIEFVDAPTGGGGGGNVIAKIDVVSSLPVTPASGVEAVFLTQDDGSNVRGFYLWEGGSWAHIDLGGDANVQSNWEETNTSSDAFIENKPTIPVKASESEVTAGTNDSNFVTPLRLQEKLDALNPTPTHTQATLTQGLASSRTAAISSPTTQELNVGVDNTITRPAVSSDGQFWILELPSGYEITSIRDIHFNQVSFLEDFTRVGQRWSYAVTNPSAEGMYLIDIAESGGN